jgi:hypothetical protein
MTKNTSINKNNTAISEAIDLLIDKGVDLSNVLSEEGLLKQLTKRLVEKALEAEMDDHLGYSKYDRTDSNNSRNGTSLKNLITDNGPITIEVRGGTKKLDRQIRINSDSIETKKRGIYYATKKENSQCRI